MAEAPTDGKMTDAQLDRIIAKWDKTPMLRPVMARIRALATADDARLAGELRDAWQEWLDMGPRRPDFTLEITEAVGAIFEAHGLELVDDD